MAKTRKLFQWLLTRSFWHFAVFSGRSAYTRFFACPIRQKQTNHWIDLLPFSRLSTTWSSLFSSYFGFSLSVKRIQTRKNTQTNDWRRREVPNGLGLAVFDQLDLHILTISVCPVISAFTYQQKKLTGQLLAVCYNSECCEFETAKTGGPSKQEKQDEDLILACVGLWSYRYFSDGSSVRAFSVYLGRLIFNDLSLRLQMRLAHFATKKRDLFTEKHTYQVKMAKCAKCFSLVSNPKAANPS